MTQKSLLNIIIIITISVVVLIGGYIMVTRQNSFTQGPTTVKAPPEQITPAPTQPLPDQSVKTTEWKTYENKEIGLRLLYPPQWKSVEQTYLVGQALKGQAVQLTFPGYPKGDYNLLWISAMTSDYEGYETKGYISPQGNLGVCKKPGTIITSPVKADYFYNYILGYCNITKQTSFGPMYYEIGLRHLGMPSSIYIFERFLVNNPKSRFNRIVINVRFPLDPTFPRPSSGSELSNDTFQKVAAKYLQKVQQGAVEKEILDQMYYIQQLSTTFSLIQTIPDLAWKNFENEVYSIQYPQDWKLQGPLGTEIEGVRDEITLWSPTGYTALTINLGGVTAGFEGGGYKYESAPISVKVGNVTYEAPEARRFDQLNYTNESDPNPPKPIYKSTPTGIWFLLEANKQKFRKHSIYIAFGNDYPSYARFSDRPDAVELYEKERSVALEILKTLRLKND